MKSLIVFNEEVQDAISQKKPVVALESTIISHGMPYPENLSCAQAVEDSLRDQGVTPATIVLYRGKIQVGATTEVLHYFAEQKHEIVKASRRDIAFCLCENVAASTTVAATMFCANLAGITLFVTGGIGGVHPNISQHFDISADIIELANSPVAVVCSGAKSILDLPKTLEMLETHSVPIVGYQTNEFPAFYTHSSGLPLLHRMDSPKAVARLIATQRQLKLNNGLVIANPIPKEAEIPDKDIGPIIKEAQQETSHLQGKSITPFLLQRITELTQGQSLKANIKLIENNAKLGGQIALALKEFSNNFK